jgi:hypothetical protein
MRGALWIVVALVSGCASGRPIGELLPDESHVQQAVGALPGEYRAAEASRGGYYLTWVPEGAPEGAPTAVGHHLGSVGELRSVQPTDFVDRAGSFEVGAQLVPAPDLPPVVRVSMALHALAPLDDPTRPDGLSRTEAFVTSDGELPPRFVDALRGPALFVEEVRPAEDGRTYRAAWRIDGARAPWGARWKGGHAAEYVVSVVVVDAAGAVGRTLVFASATTRPGEGH